MIYFNHSILYKEHPWIIIKKKNLIIFGEEHGKKSKTPLILRMLLDQVSIREIALLTDLKESSVRNIKTKYKKGLEKYE